MAGRRRAVALSRRGTRRRPPGGRNKIARVIKKKAKVKTSAGTPPPFVTRPIHG